MATNEGDFTHKERMATKKTRRSSFFKRLSLYSSDFSSPGSLSPTEEINSSEKEEETLLELTQKFKQEKEDWKNLYSKLKTENRNNKEKCSVVLDHTSAMEYLTPEDKKFLNNKPDYLAISRLVQSTEDAIALKDRRIALTTERVYNLVQDSEEINKEITASIINNMMNGFDELNLQSEQFIKENIVTNDNK